MKNEKEGSEDDAFADKKESSTSSNPTNGKRLNDDEESANPKAESTISDSASEDKESHSDDEDEDYCDNDSDSESDADSDIEVLKEKKKNKKVLIGRKRSFQPRRRSSTRLQGKRPKLIEIINSSDEEENLESDEEENLESDDDFFEQKEEKRKRGKKPGPAKKKKDNVKNSSESKQPSKAISKEGKSKKNNDAVDKPLKEFSSGSFVVQKSDYHSTMTPPIWRIDGKALLQKYIHFDDGGQTLYKNTSTYSGWTTSIKDQFYPAEIEIKSQNRQETIVKFNKGKIVVDDSD